MKIRAICLGILVLGALCGCGGRDCYDMSPEATYLLSDALKAWMTDSAFVAFEMQRSDSITDEWTVTGAYRGESYIDYQCSPRPLRKYEREQRSYMMGSHLTDLDVSIRMYPWEDQQRLNVQLGEFYGSYEVNAGVFSGAQTSEGIINVTGSIHDSVVVRGKVWRQVMMMKTTATFVDNTEIWIAKGWGMIRYKDIYGKVWERIP